MENKTKKIIASIGTAGILALGGSIPVDVKTQVQPEPLTVNEWQLLTQVYNYEIGMSNGEIKLENVKNLSVNELNNQIRARTQTESLDINGVIVTPMQYNNLRENLFEKAEQKIEIKTEKKPFVKTILK